MTSQPGKNFPEPRTTADRIALKAAELLDADIYGPVTKQHVTIRGARFRLSASGRPEHLETGFDGDGGHFEHARLSEGIEHVFQQAWHGAVERRKAILLAPVQDSIADAPFEAKQEAERARAFAQSQALGRRQRMKDNLLIAAIWAAGLVVLILIGLGIRSSSAARYAEVQVNSFGYSKADFPSSRHWTYPDECFPDDNRFSGLPDCKARLEKWESEGAVWVDWRTTGDAP